MQIPFYKTDVGTKEQQKIIDVLNGDAFYAVEDLEDNFQSYVGASYAVSTSSGTGALHLAMLAIDLKRGDKVLCSVNAHPAVPEVVRHFDAENKPIATICHGPQVLAAAGVLHGRSCTAYPACAPDVVNAGGTYMEIPIDGAYTDGNLVTAPAWPAHPDWMAAFLKVLGTKIEL